MKYFLLFLLFSTVANAQSTEVELKASDEVNVSDTAWKSGKPLMFVDNMPQFPGGEEALHQYLSNNIRYPAEAREKNIQGTVVIQFVVSAKGDIENIKVLREVKGGCSEEALRVIKSMPRWNPGSNHGHPVGVYFNLPIVFQINDDEPASNTTSNVAFPLIEEEIAIQSYLEKNHLVAQKTPSGLYYIMTKQGKGKKVVTGKKASVNYTGALLNGDVFDSNTDKKFNHKVPFEYTVGQGMVIKGWEEGVQLFNVGGKGKLIIPSGLAYGKTGAGSSIPPNSVLIYDIEVLKVK